MSLDIFKEGDCVLTTHKPCPCVEFAIGNDHRHGFQAAQLIHYTLEPNSEATGDKNKPTQKLTLAFATADVVVLGWRLAKLCDDLRNGDLLAVRALPDRYANLDQNKTFVASITVTPIAKE
jgi:hypothetical protein